MNTELIKPSEETAKIDWDNLAKWQGFTTGQRVRHIPSGEILRIVRFQLNHAVVEFKSGETASPLLSELEATDPVTYALTWSDDLERWAWLGTNGELLSLGVHGQTDFESLAEATELAQIANLTVTVNA